MVTAPDTLDVIVASNLFGDILTDIGGALQGSLGLPASANLNPERIYPSLFEPVHGSAPRRAGQGVANPMATVWAGAMLLEHLGEPEAGAPRHGRAARRRQGRAADQGPRRDRDDARGRRRDRGAHRRDRVASHRAERHRPMAIRIGLGQLQRCRADDAAFARQLGLTTIQLNTPRSPAADGLWHEADLVRAPRRASPPRA